jgi:hypothetical protein
MNRLKKKLGIVFLSMFLGSLASLPEIAKADPPPWAPAHGYREHHHHYYKHHYYYYPNQQIYYSPERRVYYYREGGVWVVRPTSPVGISLGRRVFIGLDAPVPYTEHEVIIERYPAVIIEH